MTASPERRSPERCPPERCSPERRAGRLLRWYPRQWRARYGEEFAELLIADITERPRSRTRLADVIRGGLLARLAVAGLGGSAPDPAAQVSVLACCLAIFLGLGAAIWSQLTIGWQWSAPATAPTAVAMIMMSVAMLGFLVLAVAAVIPVAVTIGSRVRAGLLGRNLLGPALLVVASALILVTGARHFGNGWPGTGGHHWTGQGLVPGGLAAFSWASTLAVSSYWFHPAALAAFPAAEIAWMTVSPIAAAGLVAGTATAIRRTGLSPAALRFEARLGTAACATMVIFLAGCCAWLVDGGPGPRNLYHAGAIDIAAVTVMALMLVAARYATRHIS
jgi:hypothetical protein